MMMKPLKPELLEAMKLDEAKFLCSLRCSLEWKEALPPDVKNKEQVLGVGLPSTPSHSM